MARHKHLRPILIPWTRTTPSTKPSTAFRHIIAKAKGEVREYSFHATKGYRSNRLAEA